MSERERNDVATERRKGNSNLLVLYIAQNTTAILLARHTRSKYNYDVLSVLFMVETVKLLLSLLLEACTYQKNKSFGVDSEVSSIVGVAHASNTHARYIYERFQTLKRSIIKHILFSPGDALKLALPALLYSIQNSIVYFAIDLLPVPLFQIIQQSKIITTTALSHTFLKRSYSFVQWASVFAFSIGTTICTLGTLSRGHSVDQFENITKGVALLITSNIISSTASICFEVVIKDENNLHKIDSSGPSIWIRNIQMAMMTLIILLFKHFFGSETDRFLLNDFPPIVWIQIMIFASGGLLVALIVKHTDSVQKSLATALSVILSSSFSELIDGNSTSPMFVLGSIVALGSLHFFNNPKFCSPHCSRGVRKQLHRPFLCLCGACFSIYLFQLKYLIQPKIMCMYSDKIANPLRLGHVPRNALEYQYSLLHVHVYQTRETNDTWVCVECEALALLTGAVSQLGVSTSFSIKRCPDINDLREPLRKNKVVVVVYPETFFGTCDFTGEKLVHVRWILGPMPSYEDNSLVNLIQSSWGQNDLIFHSTPKFALFPDKIPSQNILQLIKVPNEFEQYKLTPEKLEQSRVGTLCSVQSQKTMENTDLSILPEPRVLMHDPKPEYLKEYEYFFSDDPYSLTCFTAAMFGSISVVKSIPNTTKEDWALKSKVGGFLSENGGNIPGIAYGLSREEIQVAKKTSNQFPSFLLKAKQWGEKVAVKRLLNDCHRQGVSGLNFEYAMSVSDILGEIGQVFHSPV